MPLWVHRSTIQVLPSVAEADLPEPVGNYVGPDPDLSAVSGWPVYYWIINGDLIELADQATRDSIDAARLSASRDAIAAELDLIASPLRAFAQVVLDEINLLRAEHPGFQPRTLAQLKNAMRAKLNG